MQHVWLFEVLIVSCVSFLTYKVDMAAGAETGMDHR